jgi:hypothetical protein
MFGIVNRVLLAALLSGATALPALANKERETKKPANESATTDRTVKLTPLDHLPLSVENRQVLIECVFVEGAGRTLAMDLGVGSVVPEELRFGLGQALPLVGELFQKDGGFLPGDFGPENRVGTAAVAGSVLAVSLRPDGQVTGGGLTLEQLCAPAAGNQPAQVPLTQALAPFKLDVDIVVAANGNLVFQLRTTASTFDHGSLTGAKSGAAAGAGNTGTAAPVLADIPALGPLFKPVGSAHVQNRKLMILIRPTVLSDDDEDM